MNNCLDNANLRLFHRRLHRWYAENGRKTLPWRNTRDPYAIYVSEIMLQQTQVKTVLEKYYTPFLKRFPTLAALAAAPQKDVLKAWEGLGYYNRAVNLHETAKRCGTSLPKTIEALQALPGIGKNTAHAVAAFAYTIQAPVLEANVKRVMARIYALKNTNNAVMWHHAEALLDRKNPFDYNQAMMDLGALVCTKTRPKCDICPAHSICKGKESPESYPAKKTKKPLPVRKKNILVLQNAEGKYFATPREGRFLNGLYQFVEIDLSPRRDPGLRREGTRKVEKNRIPALAGMTKMGHITQQYSHFTLEADIYMELSNKRGKNWYSLTQLKKLPFSAAEQKILNLLSSHRKLAA